VPLEDHHHKADREIVGLVGCLAEVKRLARRNLVAAQLLRDHEGFVTLILPSVEADEIVAHLGSLVFIALPFEDDTILLAVVQDFQSVKANLLPLLLGEVLAAVVVMRIADDYFSLLLDR